MSRGERSTEQRWARERTGFHVIVLKPDVENFPTEQNAGSDKLIRAYQVWPQVLLLVQRFWSSHSSVAYSCPTLSWTTTAQPCKVGRVRDEQGHSLHGHHNPMPQTIATSQIWINTRVLRNIHTPPSVITVTVSAPMLAGGCLWDWDPPIVFALRRRHTSCPLLLFSLSSILPK